MPTTDVTPGSAQDRDPNRFKALKFPTLNEAVKAVLANYDDAGRTPYRVEIGLLASREVTYKVHEKESEDFTGGVVSV